MIKYACQPTWRLLHSFRASLHAVYPGASQLHPNQILDKYHCPRCHLCSMLYLQTQTAWRCLIGLCFARSQIQSLSGPSNKCVESLESAQACSAELGISKLMLSYYQMAGLERDIIGYQHRLILVPQCTEMTKYLRQIQNKCENDPIYRWDPPSLLTADITGYIFFIIKFTGLKPIIYIKC